jgi:glyoxylase-like metal-dependent hydrolase (beta-lactamase superfamily II)
VLQVKKFTFNPFQENTYILFNEYKHAIIIDPGMYEITEFDFFFKYISDEGLTPILLLNTHTHLDHIFGNAAVMMKYKIKLGFHKLDRPVFDSQAETGERYGLTFVKSPEPNIILEEGEMINLGEDSLKILFTPGHSPGSVCFYHEKQGFIISGDVLFQQSIGRSDLPGGNHEILMQSIHKQLMVLPNDVIVHSGHGPDTSIGLERMNNPFLISRN